MNRLFGVTMAERGVSQLVSVDLEDAVEHSGSERGVTYVRLAAASIDVIIREGG